MKNQHLIQGRSYLYARTHVRPWKNREFKKRLRPCLRLRQQVRYKTIWFNEQTNGLHVRYDFWYIYIYLSYSAKQQRQINDQIQVL